MSGVGGSNPLSGLLGMGSIAGLIDRAFGTSQTTSGGTTATETKGQNVTPEALQSIINGMLSGAGGVKDISGAARGAGLFNSSTEALLRNDLATRVAGKAAELSTPTTDTKTTNVDQTVSTPSLLTGANLAKLAIPLAIGAVGKPILGMLSGQGSGTGDGILGGVAKALGLTSGNPATDLPGLAQTIEGNAGKAVSQSFAAPITSALEGLTSAGSGVAGGLSSVLGGSLDSAPSFASTAFSAPISDTASSLASGAAGAFGSAGGPISGILSGLISGNDPNDMGLGSLAGSALGGLATMGPAGLLAGPAFSILGNGLGSSLKSIICTALKERGLLDKYKYELGQMYLEDLSEATILGYYSWGVPVANKIAKNSAWTIAICLPWATSRMNLLAAQWKHPKLINNFKYPLGALTKFVGEPLCWIIGKCIMLSNSIMGLRYGSK